MYYYPSWWHRNPNWYMMYDYRQNPPKIRRRHRSHLASISNHPNQSKPDFEAVVSNAFEMNHIDNADLKKALIQAFEQAIDYDEIYEFVREKLKSSATDVRIIPRPSASEYSWLDPPGTKNEKHLS